MRQGFFPSLEERMTRAAGAIGLRPGQLTLAFLVAAIVVGIVVARAAMGSAPRYAVSVTGTIPSVEAVGTGVIAPLQLRNTARTLPDLVVDVGGCTDHWVLDGVTADGIAVVASSGGYYEFGELAAGRVEAITLHLVPRDAGNHRCAISVWAGPLSGGAPPGR